MTQRPIVAIFAGSSTPKDPVILEAAAQLGRKLAQAGYDISYGAGTGGVMGAVARAALEAGGHVVGVVFERYADEAQFPGVELIPVKTEQERFEVLSTHRNPVACFALPGGPGTLREALQGLEKAVYDGGPDVILVQAGAYLDGIRNYFDLAVSGGLIKESKKGALKTWSPQDPVAGVLPPRLAPAAKERAPNP